MEDYKKAFALLDGNKNGEIDKDDISEFIRIHLGKIPPKKSAKYAI